MYIYIYIYICIHLHIYTQTHIIYMYRPLARGCDIGGGELPAPRSYRWPDGEPGGLYM